MSSTQMNEFVDSLIRMLNDDHDHEEEGDHDHDKHRHEESNIDSHSTCLRQKLNRYKVKSQTNLFLNETSFSYLSSLILADISDCYSLKVNNKTRQPNVIKTKIEGFKTKNWIFAFASAIIISIIGLLCYFVVPSLNSFCYNYLFQFLVALAVGTLTGDALLHLIPHAFMENHDHSGGDHEHNHNVGVYKGLGAVVGIYVFFIIEKLMQMRRARKEKQHKQTEMQADTDESSQQAHDEFETENASFLQKKKNSLTHNMLVNAENGIIAADAAACIDDNIIIDNNQHQQNQSTSLIISKSQQLYAVAPAGLTPSTVGDDPAFGQVFHGNKELKYISNYLPNNKCSENIDHHDHENEVEHLHQHRERDSSKIRSDQAKAATTTTTPSDIKDEKMPLPNQTSLKLIDETTGSAVPVIQTQRLNLSINDNQKSPNKDKSKTSPSEHRHHNHSHSHSHSHSNVYKHTYKSSREKAHHDHHKKHEKEINDVKLIAWMVLMGDGLHNFADGLAIGASFAASITTGFGTAIAVLCHELPHEIGDFAVLRRAGVSLKRALVFNAVSGVLCIFGVLVGLLIGILPGLKNWTFLFIAGTFLYISLVDMIPELSEDKEDDSFLNFFIQSIGILTGVGIMLAVALLESKIITMFDFF
jgi:zinc transporter ZupT